MRKEFDAQAVVIDEEVLTARLREVELFLELQTRDASDIGSLIGTNKRLGLEALGPLVAAGLVTRVRVTKCPVCNVSEFRRLDELDETVACRHCRAAYPLEVRDAGGQEPVLMYRLDGLVARAMDQDVVPVLLTVRAFARTFGSDYTWPGVVFEGPHQPAFDVDVLAYNGSVLRACECKRTAGGLTGSQLNDLLAFCERVNATPAIAALEGAFAADLRARVEDHGGVVFERERLLQIQ